MRTGRLAMVAVALLLPGYAGAGEFVWWEGEAPVETNFPNRSWYSPSTFKDNAHLLSEGAWLSISGARGKDEAFARYKVRVPAAGQYAFWARKFWKHGPFRWRFDASAWQTCGRDIGLADDTYLKEHVGANWVFLGDVKLAKGDHTFELRLLAKEGDETTACFDCFILSRGVFIANGKLKPGQRSGRADAGRFAYEPGPDAFTDGALLDLRDLNEQEAGRKGFVRRDGMSFALGDGKPVRFWGVNVGPNIIRQSRTSIDYMARKLAKFGVNMVRYHGPIFDDSTDVANVDSRTLDSLHYTVAALKKQGIYTTLSFHFPLWFSVKPHYGIEGFDGFGNMGNKRPFALLYFDKRMQEIHRSWARKLLTARNPYTGHPLSAEPAVAIVEIINEDSFFFWTFSKKNVPPAQWEKLEGLFGNWLVKRYGSVNEALAAWGKAGLPQDAPDQGRAGIYEAWHMTGGGLAQGGPDKRRRVGDQVRFLTELQRDFYAATVDYYKKDLGSGSLVSASNWQVTDAAMLDALERYTYGAGDVIDRHGYFGGSHEGEGANYSVRVGHTFTNVAAVNVPERLPLQFFQTGEFPHIITEIGWTNPNRYRADAMPLASAYGSLQGVDGFYLFAVGNNALCDTTMTKFALTCPVIIGTFPAAALLYRRGDVAEAGDVVRQVLRLDDLYAMKGSGGSAAMALDELRKQDIPSGEKLTGAVGNIDPLSFYVGRVVRRFGTDPKKSARVDLSRYLDRQAKTIRSMTGELYWDYGNGIATVDTERSQAAAGFLSKAGKVELSVAAIESGNEFGSVMIVSLDGRPLPESRKILIQAMTEELPYGFRVEGNRITSLGGWPFGLTKIDATVTLKLTGGGRARAVALDENGYATDKSVTVRGGDTKPLSIRLAEDAIYHVVIR